ALLKPSIGIVTAVRDDHSSTDYPREAIAARNGKLIGSLPGDQRALPNADDTLVLSAGVQRPRR
ncbi:MAG: hypothetical protein IPN98_18085, partial [Propionivibrio sp.]|nr:hypothetical protein [Propionivibrio sp.]